MAKSILMWMIIALTGTYLVFRAITPIWFDLLFFAVGSPIFLWSLVKGKANDTQQPAADSPQQKND